MSGAAVAVASGVGYGVFQAFNRRSAAGIRSVYLATFMQLVIALAVLIVACAASGQVAAFRTATAAGIVFFCGAGLVHFFCGWTLLNASQARIGAARSSPLLSTVPVFGALIAIPAFSEVPSVAGWVGIALVVAGSMAVAGRGVRSRGLSSLTLRDAAPGLACALAWSISPVLIRNGLEGLDSPLLGVTIGLLAAVLVYAATLPAIVAREGGMAGVGTRDGLLFKLLAGLLVGVATWWRYVAFDSESIALVLGLSLLSVPTVLALSPLLMGRQLERVTMLIWAGAALVVGGSLLLVVAG